MQKSTLQELLTKYNHIRSKSIQSILDEYYKAVSDDGEISFAEIVSYLPKSELDPPEFFQEGMSKYSDIVLFNLFITGKYVQDEKVGQVLKKEKDANGLDHAPAKQERVSAQSSIPKPQKIKDEKTPFITSNHFFLETQLKWAAGEGNLKRVRELLNHGAEVNHLGDLYCETPLMMAARNGHLEVVNELLNRRAAINQRNMNSCTALELAASNGHLGVVDALLNRGATIDSDSDALINAAEGGYVEIVSLLIANRAAINYSHELDRVTALTGAARNGNLAIVDELLNHGANINHLEVGNDNALSLAVDNGHVETVRLLLERGAEMDWHHFGLMLSVMAPISENYMAIKELIEEDRTDEGYERRKIEIELFFRGTPLSLSEEKTAVSPSQSGLLSAIGSIFSKKKPSEAKEVKPVVYFPEDLVGIIEDYAKPVTIASPIKKFSSKKKP